MNRSPLATSAEDPGSPAMGRDVTAGLVAAAVVLPKAKAYATVAGLPVGVGLYTAFVPMVIYALLGSSRVLSVSSTSMVAILTGTQLGSAWCSLTAIRSNSSRRPPRLLRSSARCCFWRD